MIVRLPEQMRKSIEKDLPNGVINPQIVQLFFGPIAADDPFPTKRRRSLSEIVAGVVKPWGKILYYYIIYHIILYYIILL